MTSRHKYANTREYIQSQIPFISDPSITYKHLFNAMKDLYPRSTIQGGYSVLYHIKKTFLKVRIRNVKIETFISNSQSNITFSIHIHSANYKSISYNYTHELSEFPIIEVKIQRKVEDMISRSVYSYLKEHSPFTQGNEINSKLFTDISDIYCVCGKRFEKRKENDTDFDNSDKFTMLRIHQIVEVRRHLREDECITNDNKFVLHNLRIP